MECFTKAVELGHKFVVFENGKQCYSSNDAPDPDEKVKDTANNLGYNPDKDANQPLDRNQQSALT